MVRELHITGSALGRRSSSSLELFNIERSMEFTGATADRADEVRRTPIWPVFETVGHPLAYDHSAILGEDASVPTGRAAVIAVPTLIMDGEVSYPFMHATALALAKTIPHARHRTLDGQMHEVSPEALAPVLIEFFKA